MLDPRDRPAALAALAEKLGYPPGEVGRLPVALTHKSFANEAADDAAHNETLEFLGDAVVGLLVADALMRGHPAVGEGKLSRLRAGLVNTRSLAEVAATLRLGDLLRLGRGEERTGGRRKASLLADAYEAMVAAVYLDLGLPAARAAVHAHFGARFAAPETSLADRDYKTRMQEFAQARFKSTPKYEVVGTSGPDHEKHFEVALWLDEAEVGRGTGPSKKSAERAAARDAWDRLHGSQAPE